MDTILTFASNRLFDTFREVEAGGKTWLVVNGVPLVEGVLNGRFVSADEFGAFPSDWNDIPIVLPHPKQNGGSARVPAPDVPTVGRFYNSKLDGKRLVGEYWLDKQMLIDLRDNEKNQDAETILNRVEKNQQIETSTGYWSESVPKAGRFKNRDYSYVDQNIHPDHIALLTQEAGACSLADGCGMNRNEADAVLPDLSDKNFAFINGNLWQNVTGSLPAEGKKIYERVYQKYKDEDMSDTEAAKRAWGAVKAAGWKEDKAGKWMKTNHYGPGPHKSGSPQSVHGGAGSGSNSSSSFKKHPDRRGGEYYSKTRNGNTVYVSETDTGWRSWYFQMEPLEEGRPLRETTGTEIEETFSDKESAFAWANEKVKKFKVRQNQQDLEGLAVALLLAESIGL